MLTQSLIQHSAGRLSLRRRSGGWYALAFSWALVGCSAGQPGDEEAPPPVSVPVSRPLQRDVIDHAEFAARVAAVESVKVRARVWGHLDKVYFVEGSEVKKGDLLFQIDRRPYQVAVDK